jgi:hypothetical protein
VFVDGQALGGSDDLIALESAGRLDPLLRNAAAQTSVGRAGE